MTRIIEKNNGTQVNSRTIGVLVHPNTYPPIVTVADIVVDYSYQTINVENDYDDTAIITDGGGYAYNF